MNSDIIKRIVRAIAEGSQPDLDRLALKIVQHEKELGHTKTAEQLQTILSRPRSTNRSDHLRSQDPRVLKELPLSRRHGEELATILPRESLEHHMVLPAETEERFVRIEREYAARERLGVYGLRPRKTVLLYGAPGCGKTLGAKRLAWNTGLPLLKVRFDALISSYFGESTANLRSVFIAAKERPCVLLLDECDFIARSRVNNKDIGEASRIVNSLLLYMDEFDAPGLLVATTNIESSLDTALFRRFDDVIQVPLPGKEEIEKLLRVTLSAMQTVDPIDWQLLAESLSGVSAATVVKVAQDAAKTAILSGSKAVSEMNLKNVIAEIRRSGDIPKGL